MEHLIESDSIDNKMRRRDKAKRIYDDYLHTRQ